jgi:hypothetical protein
MIVILSTKAINRIKHVDLSNITLIPPLHTYCSTTELCILKEYVSIRKTFKCQQKTL